MLSAHLAVLVAAVLFGTTFVVVKDAVAHASPVPFLAVRFLVGAVALAPFARRSPGVLRAGGACGVALLAGYLLQTVGLQYATASVSAFVTYLLVVIVPVLAAVVLRRRPDAAVLAGVVLATAGLLLLSGGLDRLGRGELLTLGAAFAFAAHIVVVAQVAERHRAATLTAVQLAVVGVACAVTGVFTGGYAFPLRAWLAAVYTGVAATAVALGLQVWGQRRVGPARTSLLLMVEPVSAAFLAAVLGERLGWSGAAGAALILAGIALAELPVLGREERLDRPV